MSISVEIMGATHKVVDDGIKRIRLEIFVNRAHQVFDEEIYVLNATSLSEKKSSVVADYLQKLNELELRKFTVLATLCVLKHSGTLRFGASGYEEARDLANVLTII